MLQFEVADSATDEMLAIMDRYGRRRAEEIESAYLWAREILPLFPNLGTAESGRARVLHRARLYWVYEVSDGRVRLLSVLDPRKNLPQT